MQPRTHVRIGACSALLALLASLFVVAAALPARADGIYCGKSVLGAIEQRYLAMGGTGGKLGCPLTDELVNPDGFGRRSHFQGGSIYWSGRSGAWPVWGRIGETWGEDGYERGLAGYPVSYEWNPVHNEIHQEFQCARYIWHQDTSRTERILYNTCK